MGTNFYKVKPIPQSEKDEMIDAIKHDRIELQDKWGRIILFTENGDWIEPTNPEIHIGKRSGGWKFLFNSNDWKYYDTNKESLIAWLKNPDTGVIKNEYGDTYTFEQFWDQAMETYNTPWVNGRERYDGESYHKDHPSDPYWGKTDYYVDGLRFSTSTEFS